MELTQQRARTPPTPIEVLARVTQREQPDWAAHNVLRRTMNHAEQPEVIRGRMLEVMRTLQRVPEGSDRDALDAYRHQLAAIGRAIEQPPAVTATQPTRSLARSPRPRGPSIEL